MEKYLNNIFSLFFEERPKKQWKFILMGVFHGEIEQLVLKIVSDRHSEKKTNIKSIFIWRLSLLLFFRTAPRNLNGVSEQTNIFSYFFFMGNLIESRITL
jgi:hypothetical protein